MFEYDQEVVKSLLVENNDFKRLYDKHGKLEQKLEEANSKLQQLDDITLGTLKKQKLHIKDQMATYVENYRQTNTA